MHGHGHSTEERTLIRMLKALDLNVLTIDQDPLGLEAVVVNFQVFVLDAQELREKILKETDQFKFSIHPSETNMYRDMKRY
ncbi:hypothetical protein Bca101_075814 [Brassica carinata]